MNAIFAIAWRSLKYYDFNEPVSSRVWLERSNQLSYEAIVASWSFVGSDGPVEVLNFSGFSKIALITAKIIASLDFISAVHI